MRQWIERSREYTYTDQRQTKTASKGKNKKELLAPIMVNQYNKQCVVKREDVYSEKGRRLQDGRVEIT